MDSYNRYVRYFTDASYWIYLVHFPITIALSGFLTRFEAPAAVKFLNVQIVTTAAAILSYHYFVRTTFIGEMLNGKRYSRSLPPAAQESAEVTTSG
jgi:peptidoglycan/LPS O-acetylase OafA/YrhL